LCTCSIVSIAYLFYVSFAGLGLERADLGLHFGLVTAGLDYNAGYSSESEPGRRNQLLAYFCRSESWNASHVYLCYILLQFFVLRGIRKQQFATDLVISYFVVNITDSCSSKLGNKLTVCSYMAL